MRVQPLPPDRVGRVTKVSHYREATSPFWSVVFKFRNGIGRNRDEFAIDEKVGERTLTDAVNDIAKAIIKDERKTRDDREVADLLASFVNGSLCSDLLTFASSDRACARRRAG